MAHDVFISYSTKDKTIADAVCAKLEENKIRVWIAPRDVAAGSNFGESIIRAINTCKVFVLIWSANTNTSNHILNEINQAFDQGITIIPFRIQDIQPSDEMRYYFGRTHWLDAINPPLENHINTLRDTILVNLGRELQPAAPAPVLEPSPGEVTKPPDEPRREEKPVLEKAEVVKPPIISPPRKKSRKIDPGGQPKKAAPGKLKKYLPIAAGGLVLLTVVILLISGVFKGLPPAEEAEPLASQMATITPTKTIRPTATATPIPAWVNEANALAEPILAAVKDLPPDFADDFSQIDPNWLYDLYNCPDLDTIKANISNSSMQFTISPDCSFIGFTHPDFKTQSGDFVIQLDINFLQTNLSFEFAVGSPNGLAVDFSLSDKSWDILENIPNSDRQKSVSNGQVRSSASKPVKLTIIKKGTTFLFYLDSVLLTSYSMPVENASEHDLTFAVNNWGDTLFDPETLLIDNIKIWELDRLDIANHFQKSDLVDEAIAFSEPILAAVKDTPPNFEDDFSQVDPGWFYEQYEDANNNVLCSNTDEAKVSITDGSMKFGLAPSCQQGNLSHPDLQYANYVLQLDVNFKQTSGEFLLRKWISAERYNELNFDFNPSRWAFNLVNNGNNIDRTEGRINFDSSIPVTVTIINQSPNFLAYLNSILVLSYNDLDEGSGPTRMDFIMANEDLKSSEVFELDNIKIWDLDRIQ